MRSSRCQFLRSYGEKDMGGPPTIAREMAALVPSGRCEIIVDAGQA